MQLGKPRRRLTVARRPGVPAEIPETEPVVGVAHSNESADMASAAAPDASSTTTWGDVAPDGRRVDAP